LLYQLSYGTLFFSFCTAKVGRFFGLCKFFDDYF